MAQRLKKIRYISLKLRHGIRHKNEGIKMSNKLATAIMVTWSLLALAGPVALLAWAGGIF